MFKGLNIVEAWLMIVESATALPTFFSLLLHIPLLPFWHSDLVVVALQNLKILLFKYSERYMTWQTKQIKWLICGAARPNRCIAKVQFFLWSTDRGEGRWGGALSFFEIYFLLLCVLQDKQSGSTSHSRRVFKCVCIVPGLFSTYSYSIKNSPELWLSNTYTMRPWILSPE